MPLARTNRGTKNQTYASTSANTLVSNSFTPAAGALLVVMFAEITDDASHSLTVTSSHSGTGSWTTYTAVIDDGFGSYAITRIAWAVCGASPGAGTVTCTRNAGLKNMGMGCEFVEVSGQDSTPVPQNKTNTVSATDTLALNFTSAPASTSYLFFACHDGNSVAPTAPSGTTALGSYQTSTGGFYGRNAEKLGSGSQNNSFTGLGYFISSGVAIEVAEQSGYPITKRWGGVTHAAITNEGRW